MDDMKFTLSENGKNITENVYYTLKENILNWNLKPQERISEKSISEKLGVSRTPVRESFIKLSNEGLIRIKPQRGSFISKINLDDAFEGIFIRNTIESEIIKTCWTKLCYSDFQKLKEIIDMQSLFAAKKNYMEFYEYDDLFHRTIFVAANKKISWRIVSEALSHYVRLRTLVLVDSNGCERILDEHSKILNALKEKKPEKALEYFKEHTTKIHEEKQYFLQKYPTYF